MMVIICEDLNSVCMH